MRCLLWLAFEYQRGEISENEGGGDSACGGGQASRKYADKASLVYCLAHAACYYVSKACKRHCRTAACEFKQRLVKPERSEKYTGANVADQYSCGSELCLVDEYLRDNAKRSADNKGFCKFNYTIQHILLLSCLYADKMRDARDVLSLLQRGGIHKRACRDEEDVTQIASFECGKEVP